MKSNAFVAFIATSLVTLTLPIEGWAQQINMQDPIALEQQLLRWQMEDMTRQRAEAQRERIQKQREESHDRQMCVRAGFRGTDIEQCVRDSALYRRRGNDFSAYG